MYVCNVVIERTNIRVLFTLLFAVGSDISILKAPMEAAISPFMSPLNPPNPPNPGIGFGGEIQLKITHSLVRQLIYVLNVD